MPTPLTKKEKSKCRVILSLLITALFLQRVSQSVDSLSDEDLPAVKECLILIDELFENTTQDRRTLMVNRIQLVRLRLTKKVKRFDVNVGLIASLRVVTGNRLKSKPGSRLDFIRTNFSKNLKEIEKVIPANENDVSMFERHLINNILSV